MERYGGCGLIPSGAYHMELPTTVTTREIDAPRALLEPGAVAAAMAGGHAGAPGQDMEAAR
jgi:hypothetical protein